MPTIRCPNCSASIENHPAAAGELVMCPNCRARVRMPGEIIASVSGELQDACPPPPPVQGRQMPPFIVVNAPTRHPAASEAGWFSRGFEVTCGVVFALFCIFVLLPIALFVLCAGIGAVTQGVNSNSQPTKQFAPAK